MAKSQVNNQPPSPSNNPYAGFPIIGIGMTGIVLDMGDGRVVKTPKQYPPESYKNAGNAEYMNEIKQQTLQNEIKVFERLGHHKGIIHCFKVSEQGIELAAAESDLETYLETHPKPENSLKMSWMLGLIDAFSYTHSRKVFVDDIALRNILVLGGELKLADFGQSILLPLDIDINSASENLTAKIEVPHLGWIIYSIASWRVHRYYFSDSSDLSWPGPDSFPDVDGVLCGNVIRKCWCGEYTSMEDVQNDLLFK